MKTIRIGPSWKKFPLDFLMLLKTLGRLIRRRYDLIFSHEEAAIFGTALARLWKVPHVYDMHSSLPQQLENFQFTSSRFWVGLMRRMERYVLKRSAGVIVICPDLLEQVRKAGRGDKAVLLENFLDFETPPIADDAVREERRAHAREDEKIVLYAGNFQPYQGIPLLLEAASLMAGDPVVFLLVGDTPEAVEAMRDRARELGIAEKVRFTGQVAPEEVPLYLRLADVLVSPRLSGTNTPLKIYSFLKSGKPLVATDLWTHSQVLDTRIAFLVEPRAQELAEGLRQALFTPEGAARAKAARDMADSEYTESRYQDKLAEVLNKTRDAAPAKGKRSP
jgi:glycosyltransferase involved in cell wall biosynthesis